MEYIVRGLLKDWHFCLLLLGLTSTRTLESCLLNNKSYHSSAAKFKTNINYGK